MRVFFSESLSKFHQNPSMRMMAANCQYLIFIHNLIVTCCLILVLVLTDMTSYVSWCQVQLADAIQLLQGRWDRDDNAKCQEVNSLTRSVRGIEWEERWQKLRSFLLCSPAGGCEPSHRCQADKLTSINMSTISWSEKLLASFSQDPVTCHVGQKCDICDVSWQHQYCGQHLASRNVLKSLTTIYKEQILQFTGFNSITLNGSMILMLFAVRVCGGNVVSLFQCINIK